MYDIILVNFNSIAFSKRDNCNQGLASIEAYLKSQNIACMVIDYYELDQYIHSAPAFGFSVHDCSYSAAAEASKNMRHKTVIWGGWTPSAIPEWILQHNPNVDYIILGEGEKRLEHLLLSLQQPMLFCALDGIAYRDEKNNIQVRPPENYLDLNALPMPTDLAVMNDMVFVELSRGCYGNCGYCQETPRMRFKSPARIVEEIEFWIHCGYSNFYFGNANTLVHGKLLRQLLKEIERRGLFLRAALVGRPDDVLRNEQVLEKYFQSSNVQLSFVEVGVEANSQHVLDLIGRKTTPEINRRAVQLLLNLKNKYSSTVLIHTNMILFSHYDMTLNELIENIKFLGEFLTSRDTLSTHLYGVAGTTVWQDMQERGFASQADFGLEITEYPFTDPYVHKLHQLIVHKPFKELSSSSEFSRYSVQYLQHRCHDTMLEFYRSNDIHKAIFNFLELNDVQATIFP